MLRSIVVQQRTLGAALALLLSLAATPALAQDAPTVSMQSYSFQPTELHVAPGATVVWNNDDSMGHTVTADDGSFDSGNVDPGGTWTTTFDAPGTYSYYCIPHGAPGGVGMAAIIVVDPQ
jgi:plastocyanin